MSDGRYAMRGRVFGARAFMPYVLANHISSPVLFFASSGVESVFRSRTALADCRSHTDVVAFRSRTALADCRSRTDIATFRSRTATMERPTQ